MNQPVIGITISQKTIEGFRSNFVHTEYTTAIQSAGGLPILIPIEYPLLQVDALRRICAGILLTGGGDINSMLFNGEPHPSIGTPCDKRDALEQAIINKAVQTDWPLLGICRGHQMLNVALGGTLYTHIPAQYPNSLDHQASEDMDHEHLAHEVRLDPDTELCRILGLENMQVNSRHHQAVKDLAPILKVTARSSDGLIEGIELPGHRFCQGVQWHPESLQNLEEQRRLFSEFIKAAGK
jgi:putative glutamine amidotransferase